MGGFNEADGGVNGEEFTGRARVEGVSVVHAEAIRDPIIGVSWELGQFVDAVGSEWKRLLQLIIWAPVIATNPETTVLDVDVFGGVRGWFADDVGARGRGRFRFGI
jgi:hypothetical protein